jgi:arginase
MTQTTVTRPVRIYGVPMDLGQKRRGVDMGPSAVRYAGLNQRLSRLGLDVHDGGNISVPVREQITDQYDTTTSDGLAHHMVAIGNVCREVYQYALRTVHDNEIGVFLGGDHTISLGTIAASLQRQEKVGVLWVDAHGDFNTPQTSPSGNVHGMVVSALMGLCPPALTIGERRLRPDQMVMIATRDLDTPERTALRDSGITVLTMRHIDEQGMASVVQQALAALGDVNTLHISWDMDSLDPQLVGGVGTPVPGGLTYREAHLLMEILADDGRVRALDVVEINPILDRENYTARVAVELVASMFGLRIL